MIKNFILIVITPEVSLNNEAEIITSLFESGLQILHVRKPNYSIEEYRHLLSEIPQKFHPNIVIHNHYELLNDFDLKGVHFPESIRLEGNVSIHKIVSTSFHKLEDITSDKINFEYAFFSPVFQSISKHGYTPALELNVLRDFLNTTKNKIQFPLIALGGISDKTISQTRDIGFSGAASIGYIWENPNPVAQFNKLQKALKG